MDAAHALHEHLQGLGGEGDGHRSDDRAAARREHIAQLERGVAGEHFVEDETESTEKKLGGRERGKVKGGKGSSNMENMEIMIVQDGELCKQPQV